MGNEEKIILEDKDNKKTVTWATFCHVGALSLYLGIPFGHIVVPLVIWLIKKNEFPYVDEQGKESLNFQISMTIYALILEPNESLWMLKLSIRELILHKCWKPE